MGTNNPQVIEAFTFRGHVFRASTRETFAQHPSWWSHIDEATVREAMWHINPGDVILDVGAAYGSYTLTALACGAAYVYAWSPEGPPGEEPEAQLLKESLDLNDWQDRCSVFTTGCYSKNGTLNTRTQEFIECNDLTPGPNPVPPYIDVRRIDDIVLGFGVWPKDNASTWMKLDVEGAEVEVLKGAEKFIASRRPKIQVENHLFIRSTLGQEVRDLLEDWGYTHVRTDPYHSVSHSLYLPK